MYNSIFKMIHLYVGIIIIIISDILCWALVVSEATAVGYSIHVGREILLKLVGQELIDNVYPDSMVNYPCNLLAPFEYIRLNGFSQESPGSFPYSGEKDLSREKTKLEVRSINSFNIFIFYLIRSIFKNVNKLVINFCFFVLPFNRNCLL